MLCTEGLEQKCVNMRKPGLIGDVLKTFHQRHQREIRETSMVDCDEDISDELSSSAIDSDEEEELDSDSDEEKEERMRKERKLAKKEKIRKEREEKKKKEIKSKKAKAKKSKRDQF